MRTAYIAPCGGSGGGGELDQGVIHYDAWIRKHKYEFTRLSAKVVKQSALEY